MSVDLEWLIAMSRSAEDDASPTQASAPGKMQAPEVIHIGRDRVELIWDPPLFIGGSAITAYSISAREGGEEGMFRTVHVTPDAECCASYPKQGPARVTVTMNDGTVFTAYVAQPLGAPEKPITDDALFEKFRMASERQLNRQQADSVIARVWNLDSQSSVRSLVDALCV